MFSLLDMINGSLGYFNLSVKIKTGFTWAWPFLVTCT